MDSRIRTKYRSRPARSPGAWKHGKIPVLGLIGAIGGGKSHVAALLAERGAFVLDADAVGHALLTQRPVRDQVIARFGSTIVGPDDGPDGSATIDRRALGAIVFADPAARRDLEAIVHPRMRKTFERAIARALRRGQASAVVLDAAILLEAGWDSLCDRIVYVDASRAVRLERLSAQRGWTDETLQARERAQWPADRKRSMADAVVCNDGTPEHLSALVDRFWSTLPTLRRAPRPVEDTSAERPRVKTSVGPASSLPSDPAAAPRRD
jgi:dephospho-CoA kinase